MNGQIAQILVANTMHRRSNSARGVSVVTAGLSQYVLKIVLLASLLLLGSCNLFPDPALGITGGCAPTSSPFLQQDNNIDGRITYCEGGDGWKGIVESRPYPPGTRNIEVLLSGYPGMPGVSLMAVSNTGQTALIPVPNQPRERWQRFSLEIPQDIAQKGYHLRLDDHSESHLGWAGLGASISKPEIGFAEGMLPMLLAVLLGNAWLIAVSLCLPVIGHPRDRLLNGLLAGGCLWFLIFISYVFSTQLGSATALFMLVLPFPLGLLLGWKRHTLLKEISGMQNALNPALMLVCLVLWVGLFPFNGDGQPMGAPAMRWRDLPIDAWLPLLFGDMLARGALDVPMIGDWLSSDRPPLQVGLYLMVRDVLPHARELVYQGVSSWAQALVLLPMASLLARFMSKPAQAIALLTLSLSPLMLINTLFVWPKLLAAAFSIIYYMALFHSNNSRKHWIQAGVAAALALLSHGGALFFLIGTSLVYVIWYRRKSLTVLIPAGVLAIFLYIPWIIYQRFVDPPGDRLIKWHFAGKIPVSNESAAHAIIDAYSQLTPMTWLSARTENIAVVVKGALSVPYDAWQMILRQSPSALHQFINDDFFYLFHSMWFASPLLLIPCIAWMYWRARRQKVDPLFRDLLQIIATVIVVTLVWITMIFEGGSATIHVGAYASVLMLELAILSAVWRTNAPIFYAICVANITVALSVYIFDRSFLPDLQWNYLLGSLLLCISLLAALLASVRCTFSEIEKPIGVTKP